MVVSSTLVSVAEDAEIRLISLLAEAAPPDKLGANFASQCEASIRAGDAASLLQTVVNDVGAGQALMVLEADEAVAAFSVLAALLERVSITDDRSSDQEAALAVALADAVVQADSQAVERKITLLSILYNMRSDPKEKCTLLTKMFQLAGGSPQAASLLSADSNLGKLLTEKDNNKNMSSSLGLTPQVPCLVTTLDTWQQVAVGDRRDLYESIVSVLPDQDVRKQRFLLLLVATYTATDKMDAAAADAAKQAAIGAIRDPVSLFAHQRNMLQLPAIRALQKSGGELANLFGLLQVFQEGKLSDYEAFVMAKGGEDALLQPWGLKASACQRYMRILSLCSLASEHEEIPYKVIAETLKLDSEDDVEAWVIAAVGSGLLQAKMDQLQKKVMVERCVVRRFDMEQWKVLQSRLALWKKNVGGVLAGLKESQAGAGTSAAVASTSK